MLEQLMTLFNRDRLMRAVERPTRTLMNIMLQSLIERSPHGAVEPIFTLPGSIFVHGGTTVSQRLGHTPISQGWRLGNLMNTGTGYKFAVKNISEHVWFNLLGTKPHPEPKEFRWFLVFWWGSPLRWPPKDERPPGPRVFISVNHPGAKPNPFHRQMIEEEKGNWLATLKRNIIEEFLQ